MRIFLIGLALNVDADFFELEEITKRALLEIVPGLLDKEHKDFFCIGCRNNCLRIEMLCRPNFYLHCWRSQFEYQNFAIF